MRDYLSPAKKMLERVMPHPAAIHAFILKRRLLAFAVVAMSFTALLLGVITVRAVSGDQSTNTQTIKSEGKTSTLSTTIRNTNEPVSQKEQSMTNSQTSSSTTESTSEDSKTTVTINNETIPVPENGSVERTITSENGSTQINVTTNSDTNGNSHTSSFMTTNSNSTSINNSTISSSTQNMSITTQ